MINNKYRNQKMWTIIQLEKEVEIKCKVCYAHRTRFTMFHVISHLKVIASGTLNHHDPVPYFTFLCDIEIKSEALIFYTWHSYICAPHYLQYHGADSRFPAT